MNLAICKKTMAWMRTTRCTVEIPHGSRIQACTVAAFDNALLHRGVLVGLGTERWRSGQITWLDNDEWYVLFLLHAVPNTGTFPESDNLHGKL